MSIKHDWRAEYHKVAHLYTPEEWEEYNTEPLQWCVKALDNSGKKPLRQNPSSHGD